MGPVDDFQSRRREFARRFVRTAVVVDNEASMTFPRGDGPQTEVVAPGRHTPPSDQDDQGPVGRGAMHTLNAGSIMDSFSALGVICGVVGPKDSATEAMRKADVVILDWLLQGSEPDYTLNLLRALLTEESDRNSLRLVAIYTGEARLEEIHDAVFAQLKEDELEPKTCDGGTAISYRHGRVVIYAKSGVNLAQAIQERSVAEEELPKRLIKDFATMTEGLLPGVALTSLTAVREGEHKILDQFCAELDPAFLAHMACRSDPEDAERRIVACVAEEILGLMDNAVAAESPAGARMAEDWIRRKGEGSAGFRFGEKELDIQQTINLATQGLEASNVFSQKVKKKAFRFLTAGFARPGAVNLDERLAWIMSFRAVYNAPPPTLWLGSVVTVQEEDAEKHLLCMRPRCDSVRLKQETSFIFLPLVEPLRKMEKQLVVRLGSDFRRLGIELDSASLVRRRFRPLKDGYPVVATKRELEGSFEFTDTRGVRYAWRGELKAEYAQRIAQDFAEKLSRVAVDESEWLRRMAKG